MSIYPQRGNPHVRRDLHRKIYPRDYQGDLDDPVTRLIMWTSCREDMPSQHWVPNHFVLVLYDTVTHILNIGWLKHGCHVLMQ